MTLAVLGMGLVSPFGRSPREHALFRRARVPGPSASPFLDAEDAPVRAHACPFLDAAMPIADRMIALAETALDAAIAPLHEAGLPSPTLTVGLARERPGLDAGAAQTVTRALGARSPGAPPSAVWGEAGVFTALQQASREIARDGSRAVAVVAVDSYISLPFITHHVKHPPTRWESEGPYPSEAAAALVVASPRLAANLGVPVLATLHKSATARGASNDDNDELVDGIAMVAALRELGDDSVRFAFGQQGVDALRREEWSRATARNAVRFWECENVCAESFLGRVGASAGAVSLVYGMAMLRHGCADDLPRGAMPMLAWAVSRDGTRGAASATVDAP
ncbi:MAG: hypothetical protein U0359_23900 [Byssovorax sp.]